MTKTLSLTSIGAILLLLGVFVNLKVAHSMRHDEDSLAGNLTGKKPPGLFKGNWINSSPHKLTDYEGRVVLVEFWTYGCYNCRNTIPTMNKWQKSYAGKDFGIIGVHTLEFDRE